MKKLLMIFALLIGLVSCGKVENTAGMKSTHNDGVEVIYFHGKQRCLSCRAIERFAKEAVDSCFGNNKDVRFKTVDITTTEGEKIADTYEIAGSALVIVKTEDGKSYYEDLTKFAFRNARKNTAGFKRGIENKVREYLKH